MVWNYLALEDSAAIPWCSEEMLRSACSSGQTTESHASVFSSVKWDVGDSFCLSVVKGIKQRKRMPCLEQCLAGVS